MHVILILGIGSKNTVTVQTIFIEWREGFLKICLLRVIRYSSDLLWVLKTLYLSILRPHRSLCLTVSLCSANIMYTSTDCTILIIQYSKHLTITFLLRVPLAQYIYIRASRPGTCSVRMSDFSDAWLCHVCCIPCILAYSYMHKWSLAPWSHYIAASGKYMFLLSLISCLHTWFHCINNIVMSFRKSYIIMSFPIAATWPNQNETASLQD